jgi:hypothetical protein
MARYGELSPAVNYGRLLGCVVADYVVSMLASLAAH